MFFQELGGKKRGQASTLPISCWLRVIQVEGLVFGDDFLKFQLDSVGILLMGQRGRFMVSIFLVCRFAHFSHVLMMQFRSYVSLSLTAILRMWGKKQTSLSLSGVF